MIRFFGGQELLVSHAVGLGDRVFVVAEQRDGDAFLLRPGFLRERIVAGNAEHLGVERVVFGNAFGNARRTRWCRRR